MTVQVDAMRGLLPVELRAIFDGVMTTPSSADLLQQNICLAQGVVPAARLVLSAQPTANDTIGIGGTTFIFVAALGAATSNVQVLIGASAAATLASLVKAINGSSAPAEWVEASTPFVASVVADAVSTSLRIRAASARGGSPQAKAGPNIALAEAITAGADVWNAANLNVAGRPSTLRKMTVAQVALTALMLTTVGYQIELPFTPTAFVWSATDSTGAPKTTTDVVVIDGDSLKFAQAGVTHLIAGDIVRIVAFE